MSTLAATTLAVWLVFTRSDWYQIHRILTDGPAAVAAVRGSDGQEAVAAWAEALGQLGRLDDVLSFVHNPPAAPAMSKASIEATILVKAARGLGDAGYTADAQKVAKDALSAAQRIPSEEIDSQVSVLAEVGQVLAWSGETKQATTTLSKALIAARQIHNHDQQTAEVAEVAEAMAEAGHIEDAKRLGASVLAGPPAKDSYSYAESFHLSRLAAALARAGSFGDALSLAHRIEQRYSRARDARLYGIEATSEIAQMWSQAGKADQAKRAWEEAHAEADVMEDAHLRALALAQVGRTLVRAGRISEAATVLNEAFEVAHESQTGPSAVLDWSDVATALAESGRLSDALLLARQSGYPVDALSRVAEALAHAGKNDQAKVVWEEARAAALRSDQRSRANTLVSVARAAARLHLYREARLAAESSAPTQRLNAYAAVLTEYAKEDNPTLRQWLETER